MACPNGHPRSKRTASEVVTGLAHRRRREALEAVLREVRRTGQRMAEDGLRSCWRERDPLPLAIDNACVRNLFVTGQEGSGTHFVAAFLRNMGMGEEESGAPSARSCTKQTCGGGVSHEFNGDASI